MLCPWINEGVEMFNFFQNKIIKLIAELPQNLNGF